MAGYEVQFLDVGPEPGGSRAPRTWLRLPGVTRPVTTSLWFTSAALCVIASAQRTFSYRFAGTNIRSHGAYDAWGRSLGSTLTVDGGPRYAILLWTCAGLCAAIAGVLVSGTPRSRPARWLRRRAPAVGVAVIALLAGTVAGIGLTIQASFANYRALARAMGDGAVILSVGPCLWFGIAAVLCATGALATLLRPAEPGPPPLAPLLAEPREGLRPFEDAS